MDIKPHRSSVIGQTGADGEKLIDLPFLWENNSSAYYMAISAIQQTSVTEIF